MKRSTRADATIRKQQNAKRVEELEREKQALQKEAEDLRNKFAAALARSEGGSPNVEEGYLAKLNTLESQVLELRNKLEGQTLLLKQKQKGDEAAKRLQDEICRVKAQKVELHRKIKKESVQFRSWKTLQEKETLQLKKDVRKTEYEMHKLLNLNQRLKMVLQRKTKEASMATKWLKELLKSRKASCSESTTDPRLLAIENQVVAIEQLNEVESQCEHQIEKRVRMAEEAAKFKEEADVQIQKNLWCLLQDKEAECREKDSELINLNEKVAELGCLIEQLKMINEGYKRTDKSEEPRSSLISNSCGNNVDILEDKVTSESEYSSLVMAISERTESGKGSVESSSLGGDCSFTGVIMTTKAASLACCSCSKRSLCKTNKCQCRVSGGICGISCSCSSTKCLNREELNSYPQMEIARDDCVTKTEPLCDIGNTTLISNAAKPSQRKNRSSD